MTGGRASRARLQDVADHAGVSVRSVSNVVNDYHYVSAPMRERVQASLDHLGYSVNHVARGLRSGRTGMIALVVPQLAEPYFAQLAQAVIRVAAARGLIVLVETTEDPQTETDIMHGSLRTVADGVLLSATAATIADQPDVPLVLLGEHPATQHGDHVGIDNVVAARTVVGHLLEQGCRRIAPLGVADTATSDLRLRGFRDELRAWRIQPLRRLMVHTPDWSPNGGYIAVQRLLDRPADQLPDAVFAFNDSLAYGAIRALREHGIAVPDRVAVAGMDNLATSAFVDPPLTSLAPDLDYIAENALTLLVKQIEGNQHRPRQQRVFTPFELKARASSLRTVD